MTAPGKGQIDMSYETKHAPDPLEPLRKMIEKWDGEYVKTLKFCCHGACATDLAAALPALEEAMTRINALSGALIAERDSQYDENVALIARIAKLEKAMAAQDACIEAMQEPMACGHFAVNLQPFDSGHEICIVCAERDAARGEARQDAFTVARAWMGTRQPTWDEWLAAFDRLDPSAVKAAEEQR